ncbi:hypothetical protein VKT23_013503 [Stygiomarasmius scandens]|uniref:Uncharacterized protein n=1 Tax=Marasmiellus scandens TaxID=2682957 RepID=A0ABR1J6D3_9AGAR
MSQEKESEGDKARMGHGGARKGAGRPRHNYFKEMPKLYTSETSGTSVAGTPGKPSTFFAPRSQLSINIPSNDNGSSNNNINNESELSNGNDISVDEYLQFWADCRDVLGDESEAGTGDAEIDESLINEIQDDIDKDMKMAEQENDEMADKSDSILRQYLSLVLQKIRKNTDAHQHPDCYKQGTFWIYPKDAPFYLHESEIQGINPSGLYHLPVFVWLPDMLPGAPSSLKCPNGHDLIRNGYNKDPIARRVRDMANDYFLLTNRLRFA